MFKNSRVAVLDLTHGGIAIARKLNNIAASVTAIDVYKTLSDAELERLEREGIRTSRDALNAVDFDVIIAPVHLDPSYPMLVEAANKGIPILSHHAAVGEIIQDYGLNGKTIIEITGTRAKTSTSVLLAEMLSMNRRVISHTSRGMEDWNRKKVIKKGLSITPASVLAVLDEGLDFDVLISEISLGGTGSADIGVITTIANDYKIANNTKLASDAKRQMILNAKPRSTLVINYDALRSFGACRRDINIISFSDEVNAASNVYYEEIDRRIAYYLNNRQGRIRLREASDYDVSSYRTAFVCATAVALAMNTGDDTIERAIKEFRGAEGRMRKTTMEGRTLIDNSNSGMDIKTAGRALSYVKSEGGRMVMVLGEEAQQVCEGLDPAAVRCFIDKHMHELDALILVGKRMRPILEKNVADNIHYSDNLPEGLELAIRLTREKDIILSCVKCFR